MHTHQHTDRHTLEPWEHLQARLFHLGSLGEELPAFVATPGGTWLFAEIAREAATIARIAETFLTEAQKTALTSGTGPAARPAVADRGPVPAAGRTHSVSGGDTGTATGGGEAL
jgi:hypothetical protein